MSAPDPKRTLAGSKSRSAAGFCLSNLVYIAHDPARGDIRAAPRFERARTAGRYRCLVADPMIGADVAGSGQLVARWADINVAFLIKTLISTVRKAPQPSAGK